MKAEQDAQGERKGPVSRGGNPRCTHRQQEAELGATWAQETFLFLALIGDPTQSGWKRAQIKRLECWVETRAG